MSAAAIEVVAPTLHLRCIRSPPACWFADAAGTVRAAWRFRCEPTLFVLRHGRRTSDCGHRGERMRPSHRRVPQARSDPGCVSPEGPVVQGRDDGPLLPREEAQLMEGLLA